MAKLFNRAKMTTATTGSGTVTLGSASNGFQTFAAAGVSNGDVVQYVIEEGANFEIGVGTYSSTGTSLTRSPTESSNSNNAITLAGQATVSITAVADDLNRLQHGGSDKVTVSSTGASVTGNLAVSGTVDGRNVASDGSKLDGIEASADVTDTANVTAAGALMDSEVTNLAQVKAFDSSDYATAAQGTTADAALPKAGGTMTAPLTIDTNTSGMLRLSASGGGPWAIDLQRDDATNSKVYNAGGYWAFEHEPRYYNGGSFQKLFHDGYHPNADTLTTARTINGVSFNGSANITVADSTKLPLAGGTITGHLGIGGTATDTAWNDAAFGNTEVSIDGGGGYGVLHFRGDGAGSTDTRYSVAVGDNIFYMAYDDVDGVHRVKINSSHQLILNEGSGDRRAFHDGYHPNADTLTTARTINGVSFNGSANITVADSTKLPLSGGTMTGELQLNARLDVGDGTGNDTEIRIKKADNDVSDHIQFFNGTTRVGEIGCQDNSWLRINQFTANNIYTPRYIRADGGLFVGNTTKGINASGNFIGGTITGASDANVSNWNTAYTTANAALPKAGGTMTGAFYLQEQKINFKSGAGGTTFGTSHYSMGVDIANGSWSNPNYSDLIIGYHTGIRLGAAYTGIRFYDNSPTTDTNNTGNGNGGEALIMTVGGTQGAHVNVQNNLTVGANATISGDLTANGGAGAITLNNSDIRSAQSNPTWTGNPGTVGKIQYHSSRWYIVADQASNRIVQFRRDGSDKSYIDNNGDLQSGKAAGWITSRTLSLTGAVTGSVSWDGTGNASLSTSFNDNGPNYIDVATGNYGTVKVDDDRGLSWAGYAIRDDWVFMSNGSSEAGIYNDTDNEWAILCQRNDYVRLFHNGLESLRTIGVNGIRVGAPSSTSSDIIMSDADHGERRIHCNSNRIGFLNTSNNWSAYSEDAGHWVVAGNITASGNVNSQSDVRVKENIEPISDAMQKVQSINGVTFNRNDLDDTETRYVGVIAQDVEAVLPEAVSENGEGIKQVAYGNMVGLLIEAIKEQQTQIDDLKAEIQSMKS